MTTNCPRGIVVVAVLMIVFGLAEVTTGFSHHFFGLTLSQDTWATYAGAAIGGLYAMAGLLVLTRKRRAAAIAIAMLIAVVVGRISMVAMGLYPIDSFKQTIAMILGTSIVVSFAVYIRLKWSFVNRRVGFHYT